MWLSAWILFELMYAYSYSFLKYLATSDFSKSKKIALSLK